MHNPNPIPPNPYPYPSITQSEYPLTIKHKTPFLYPLFYFSPLYPCILAPIPIPLTVPPYLYTQILSINHIYMST